MNPEAKPDNAFPNGRPINPNTPPNPNGPNIIPGKMPAINPEKAPIIGPPKKPAMKTARSEKSRFIPAVIGTR